MSNVKLRKRRKNSLREVHQTALVTNTHVRVLAKAAQNVSGCSYHWPTRLGSNATLRSSSVHGELKSTSGNGRGRRPHVPWLDMLLCSRSATHAHGHHAACTAANALVCSCARESFIHSVTLIFRLCPSSASSRLRGGDINS